MPAAQGAGRLMLGTGSEGILEVPGRQSVKRFQCFASSVRFAKTHSRSVALRGGLPSVSSLASRLLSRVLSSSDNDRVRLSSSGSAFSDIRRARLATKPKRFCRSRTLPVRLAMPNPYWSTAGGARVGPLPPAPLADRLKVPLPEPRRGFSSVRVTAYMQSRDIPGLQVAATVFLHPTDSPGRRRKDSWR